MRWLSGTVAVLALATVFVGPEAAQGTVSGDNGRIAFVTDALDATEDQMFLDQRGRRLDKVPEGRRRASLAVDGVARNVLANHLTWSPRPVSPGCGPESPRNPYTRLDGPKHLKLILSDPGTGTSPRERLKDARREKDRDGRSIAVSMPSCGCSSRTRTSIGRILGCPTETVHVRR